MFGLKNISKWDKYSIRFISNIEINNKFNAQTNEYELHFISDIIDDNLSDISTCDLHLSLGDLSNNPITLMIHIWLSRHDPHYNKSRKEDL